LGGQAHARTGGGATPKLKGRVGQSWYIDETYIRVHGGWKYLYRAIDRDGALVDAMLNEHRNLGSGQALF
jgi:putative transposase